MLRGHPSHSVLKNLLHNFDERGVELGHGASLPDMIVNHCWVLKPTLSRSAAAVESTIRDEQGRRPANCESRGPIAGDFHWASNQVWKPDPSHEMTHNSAGGGPRRFNKHIAESRTAQASANTMVQNRPG